MTATAGLGSIELLASEGAVERVYELPEEGGCEIGREGSGISFAGDALMAARHASLVVNESSVSLEDLGAGSGVWLRLRGAEGRLLEDGDQLWLGAQLLLVRRSEDDWQICHHGADGRLRERHPVPLEGVFIGRTSALVLDLADGQLSRRHAQIVREGASLRFYDRGAHNGSYLKIRGPETLSDADEFRVGAQRFRFAVQQASLKLESQASPSSHDGTGVDADSEATVLSAFSEDEIEKGPDVVSPAEPALAISRPAETASLASRLRRLGTRSEPSRPGREAPLEEQLGVSAEPDGNTTKPMIEPESEEFPENDTTSEAAPANVDLADHGAALAPSVDAEVEQVLIVIDSDSGSLTLEAPVGATILEAVQASGAERGPQVDWECGDGECGVCVLGVVEGADRMDPPNPATGEMKTIQITEQVAPDPNRYRLACLARVRGAVRLRKLT